MNLDEEKKLVEKAKKDKDAFGKIYDCHYSQILNYSLKRTANVKIAQDITSEVFLKALKNLWKFRWKNISISFWLYRIANNEISDYYRKNNKCVSLDMMMENDNFDPAGTTDLQKEYMEKQDEISKHQDFLKIQKAISALPEKYQETLVLKFFEKKKNNEIGEILGIKEGTIKSLIHRGLEKIKKTL